MVENVRFYIQPVGLTNFEVLRTVFEFVALPTTQKTKLTQFQEFVLTLVKLRLDLPFKDLAYRFGISVTIIIQSLALLPSGLQSWIRD